MEPIKRLPNTLEIVRGAIFGKAIAHIHEDQARLKAPEGPFTLSELTDQQVYEMDRWAFRAYVGQRTNRPHLDRSHAELAKEYSHITWFIEIKQLRSGDSFGELALIKDANRAATITAIEPCTFAVIDKDAYIRCLGKSEEKAKAKIDAFL
jgi:CRP-like cAMP-binding protein